MDIDENSWKGKLEDWLYDCSEEEGRERWELWSHRFDNQPVKTDGAVCGAKVTPKCSETTPKVAE